MSLPIWTPAALRSELGRLDALAWRLVEAQHRVSTLKLVDGLDEQQALEEILEDTKPPVPEECRHLDYLLATPFRYRPYPQGSRFRRAGFTPGVWYGAERPETAVAEMVFYRLLFYAESPDIPLPDGAAEYTAFAAGVATPFALDLCAGGLAADAPFWTHPTDYAPCQVLAASAREAGAEVIRYLSVRDPGGGANLAVLSCRAFRDAAPVERQTWRIRVTRSGAQALREYPRHGIGFRLSDFAADPRLAPLLGGNPHPPRPV